MDFFSKLSIFLCNRNTGKSKIEFRTICIPDRIESYKDTKQCLHEHNIDVMPSMIKRNPKWFKSMILIADRPQIVSFETVIIIVYCIKSYFFWKYAAIYFGEFKFGVENHKLKPGNT